MFNGFVYVIQNPDKDLSSRGRPFARLGGGIRQALDCPHKLFRQMFRARPQQNSIKIVTRNMIIVPELEEMYDSATASSLLPAKRYRKQFFDEMLKSQVFMEFCAEMNKFVQFADKPEFARNQRGGLGQLMKCAKSSTWGAGSLRRRLSARWSPRALRAAAFCLSKFFQPASA